MPGEVLARPRDVAVVRWGAAVVSGALLAVAFPGTGSQGWLAFGALIPLLVSIDGGPWRVAAALGGVAGLTFSVATIAWITPTVARYGHLTGMVRPRVQTSFYTRHGDVFAWATVVFVVTTLFGRAVVGHRATARAPARAVPIRHAGGGPTRAPVCWRSGR